MSTCSLATRLIIRAVLSPERRRKHPAHRWSLRSAGVPVRRVSRAPRAPAVGREGAARTAFPAVYQVDRPVRPDAPARREPPVRTEPRAGTATRARTAPPAGPADSADSAGPARSAGTGTSA